MSIISSTGISGVVPNVYRNGDGKPSPMGVSYWSPGDATIEYPDCDGKPMSDNTKQQEWIELIHGNLKALFRDRADVFVAADLLWYAYKGLPEERAAPDVMLVFGRPKGHRGSYMQWKENDVPATVAFEILSPGNDPDEMAKKFYFYDHYGVEEYYIYDPDTNKLEIFHRGLATFRQVHDIASYTSRRMGIRFEMTKPEMTIYGPDGKRFISFMESQAETRAERKSKARLAELSRKARRGQASAEELAELERLEDESA